MSLLVTNTNAAIIEATQYSDFFITHLDDMMLPDMFVRNVTDFQNGQTLNIPVVGDRVLQEVSEDVAMTATPIDQNVVTLTITDYVGDAFYVTDELREDAAQVERLLAENAHRSMMKIKEYIESRWLAVIGDASQNPQQTPSDPNTINGFNHRWVASGASNAITLDDFRYAKLVADKTRWPMGSRVAIIGPEDEFVLNNLFDVNTNVDSFIQNPNFEGLIRSGFMMDHRFVANIYGWMVFTSNFLPTVTETITATGINPAATGARTVTAGHANIFMSVASDSHKPGMFAWRRTPRTETKREANPPRDEFFHTTRFGVGVQRPETLICVLTP